MSPSCCSKNRFNLKALVISVFVFLGFLLLNQLNIIPQVLVDQSTFLPFFFIFGLLSVISSCGGVTASFLLSSSNKYLFLLGRIVSYLFFGFLLGSLGQFLNISFSNSPLFLIIISLVLIFSSLELIGLNCFCLSNISFLNKLPKIPSFLIGFLTFFVPCGFTFTVQSVALGSGSGLNGFLTMMFFILGSTVPLMLLVKFFRKPLFKNISGFLIIFFSLFSLYRQININQSVADLAPVVDGYQVIKMTVRNDGYHPNNFKIRSNLPVKWEIKDGGVSACSSTITSQSLLDKPIKVIPYSVVTKNFNPPKKPGVYHFSCSMGMINGSIEVIN